MVFRAFVIVCVLTAFLVVPISLVALFVYMCWRYIKDSNDNVRQDNENALEMGLLNEEEDLQPANNEEPNIYQQIILRENYEQHLAN